MPNPKIQYDAFLSHAGEETDWRKRLAERLRDGRFDASPEGMRYLVYVEKTGFKWYAAEDLVKEFYDPEGGQAAEKYV